MTAADYAIIELRPEEFDKCANIWNLERQAALAEKFYGELVSGNRQTFIYMENSEFVGEISLVFDTGDPDYSIPGQRVYLSHMLIRKDCRLQGIGTVLLEFLLDYADMLGFPEIALGVDSDNAVARYLYAKYGFTEVLYEDTDHDGPYLKLLRRRKPMLP